MPKQIREKGQRTYRPSNINTEKLEFSKGCTELHIESYQQILKGNGYGLNEATESIKIAQKIRNNVILTKGEKHPFCS